MKRGLFLTTQEVSNPQRSRVISPLNALHSKSRPSWGPTPKHNSYVQINTDKSLHSTLQRYNTEYTQDIFLPDSPKTPQQVVDDKIKVLQEWGSRKNLKHEELVLKKRVEERRRMQEKPSISSKSKQIYRSVQKKKNLNKSVLNRFKAYEGERVRKNIDNIVRVYIQQCQQVPTIKQLLKTNKSEVIDLLRNLRA